MQIVNFLAPCDKLYQELPSGGNSPNMMKIPNPV